VIPITADQDTPGPLAKSVTDAAILLGALEGARPDPHDPATTRCTPPPGRDYTQFLRVDGLRNARIGIPRANYYAGRGIFGGSGLSTAERQLMEDAIAVLKKQGATVVDPADLPSVVDKDPERNLLRWSTCTGTDNARGHDENCSVVFKYGMKRDFNEWLRSLGPSAPVHSLTELREWNVAHRNGGAIKYGQSNLDISDEMDLAADRARYETDRRKDLLLAGEHGIDEAVKTNRLDALLFPGSGGAAVSAKPGYPTVIVPFGLVPNEPTPPFPDGFNAKPQPFGVSFAGIACSEPRLLEIAFAFEQATKRRIAPPGAP
jgi:amidase